MYLLLIRHGDAELQSPDSKRPLSEIGRKEVHQLSQHLLNSFSELELQEFKVLHSPLIRAIQTKDIIVGEFKNKEINCHDNLTPSSDITQWENDLLGMEQNLILIGH